MQTDLSIEIERPIAAVFDLTTNHVTEWSITCVEEEILDEKPEGVGTTFRIATEERGKRMEFQGVVTRHEPPTASAVELKGQYFDLDVLYLFEDLGGDRTKVTQRSAVHGKGFVKVMFFLFGWLMKKSGCEAQGNELESLKKFCEERGG